MRVFVFSPCYPILIVYLVGLITCNGRGGHFALAGSTNKQPIVLGKDSVEVCVRSADSACEKNVK